MRSQARARRRRAGALAATLASVALVLATSAAAPRPPVAAEDTSARPLGELLGPTDGFAVAIEASGDLAGSLETCGCPKHPMGGFAWRSGYAVALARATKGEVPILHVDAGRAFAADVAPAGMAADVRIKNEWMLRAFDRLRVGAVNVAGADLAYLAPLMARTRSASRLVRRFPALARLVSTNIVAQSAAVRPFQPSLVATLSGPRLGGRPVRVGFLGVTEPAPPALAERLGLASSGFTIADPVEAVRRALPELRARCDLVVVLAYVDRDTALRIGALDPGPDVVVAAHQFPLFNKTDASGGATIAYVSTETKWLAELRLARAPSERANRLSVVAHRDVPLDSATPSSPDAEALVNAARAEFTAAEAEALARDRSGGAGALERERAALAADSGFVGAEACAACHAYQYGVWKASKHARAFEVLAAKNRQLDAACTVCHTVRQGERGGFLDVRLTPRLENVQCESCHGPGKQHALAPAGGAYDTARVPSTCVACHTLENDPDFDAPTYWPKVRHEQANAPRD